MIEAGLVSLLKSDSSISTIVGSRIYPVIVPATASYPCLSYHTMSKPPEVNLDNSAQETARIQIDCWGTSYASVKTLQAALHTLLDGYQGICPDNTDINLCTRDVEADYWESDSKTFRAMSEYLIDYPSGQ
jgi:hypothetical protein